MSDQKDAGAITSLEEVFLSREFGRVPSQGIWSIGGGEDAGEPHQLEQVFLSEEFGRPTAITAAAPAAAGAPALVALPGGATGERDSTRYRAIAAVSGVAAAALVVVGIATGTGQTTKQPSVSAQGQHPGPNQPATTGGARTQGGAPQPGASPTAPVGSSGGETAFAQLASASSSPAPAVVVEVPQGTTVEVVSSPPAGSSGSGGSSGTGGSGGAPPPATSTGGGGNVLTPVLVVVGNTVSTVGTTVTLASNGLGTALPGAAPVTGLLGSLGATVTSLGRSVAGV